MIGRKQQIYGQFYCKKRKRLFIDFFIMSLPLLKITYTAITVLLSGEWNFSSADQQTAPKRSHKVGKMNAIYEAHTCTTL